MTKRVLSNADLQAIKSLMKVVIDERLEEKKVVTRDDIKHLPTKDEFYERMDKFTIELEKDRSDKEIRTHKISDHEERISALEDIHPDGHHVVT